MWQESSRAKSNRRPGAAAPQARTTTTPPASKARGKGDSSRGQAAGNNGRAGQPAGGRAQQWDAAAGPHGPDRDAWQAGSGCFRKNLERRSPPLILSKGCSAAFWHHIGHQDVSIVSLARLGDHAHTNKLSRCSPLTISKSWRRRAESPRQSRILKRCKSS